MRYAVILAGGAGKRLWPLSRMNRPKQLLPLIGGKSLLEMTVDRLTPLFDIENIWIITNAEYAQQVAATLPSLKRDQIIGEPEGRDTANAIALAAELLSARDANATMAVFTADHVIRPEDCFIATVNRACQTAEQEKDALLTFGVRPTWPHTGLGYIHCGQRQANGVYQVLGFKEKPDHHTARRYVESGEHFWNSGMFVWTLPAIRKALKELLPKSAQALSAIGETLRGGGDYRPALKKIDHTLERISIDYAIMEKSQKVLCVEMQCEWLDVGSWPALENVSELDEAGNIVVAENSIVVDSFRNIIVTEDNHLLAVLGMDDCIVVHSDDATLVCNKSDSQRLKELVAMIKQKYGKKYL